MSSLDLITTATLCLFLLAIGGSIGWSVAQACLATRPAYSAVLHHEQAALRHVVSQWTEIRLRELAILARELPRPPQKIPAEWRAEIRHLARELYRGLEQKLVEAEARLKRENSRGTMHCDEPKSRDAEHSEKAMTNAQIVELLDGDSLGGDGEGEASGVVRHKLAVKQPLAPLEDGGPLTADAFHMVQFHDLSVRDVRYFVDQLPKEKRVVIGLGLPVPVKWLSAEIEDYRRTIMYGRPGYLVTARWLACIEKRADVIPRRLVGHSSA